MQPVEVEIGHIHAWAANALFLRMRRHLVRVRQANVFSGIHSNDRGIFSSFEKKGCFPSLRIVDCRQVHRRANFWRVRQQVGGRDLAWICGTLRKQVHVTKQVETFRLAINNQIAIMDVPSQPDATTPREFLGTVSIYC